MLAAQRFPHTHNTHGTHLLDLWHAAPVHAARHLFTAGAAAAAGCCCCCITTAATTATWQEAAPQVLVHGLSDEWREGSHDLGELQQHVEQRTQARCAVVGALAAL
jgi:hypothetical protein